LVLALLMFSGFFSPFVGAYSVSLLFTMTTILDKVNQLCADEQEQAAEDFCQRYKKLAQALIDQFGYEAVSGLGLRFKQLEPDRPDGEISFDCEGHRFTISPVGPIGEFNGGNDWELRRQDVAFEQTFHDEQSLVSALRQLLSHKPSNPYNWHHTVFPSGESDYGGLHTIQLNYTLVFAAIVAASNRSMFPGHTIDQWSAAAVSIAQAMQAEQDRLVKGESHDQQPSLVAEVFSLDEVLGWLTASTEGCGAGQQGGGMAEPEAQEP